MGAKTRKLSQINDSLIEWQSVVVADGSTGLTAVAGRGYFINTTGGAITVTTPASPKQGDKIVIVDYAGTFATNKVTINFNGAKVFGSSNTSTLQTNYQAVDLIFIDNTQGWRTVNQDTTSDIQSALFITATGGTVTTDGNFKIHTFTGDGCFVVSQIGNSPTTPLGGPSSVDYLVVAGGGSAGSPYGAGGGAGGFREGRVLPAPESYTASPLVAPGLPVSATTYPITVGAGAAGVAVPATGLTGSNSVFSTITSAGGGGGGRNEGGSIAGTPGGSGGGGGGSAATAPAGGAAGTGNTPPVSPPQGNPGGTGSGPGQYGAAGGGGAGSAGNQGNSTPTGSGGDGVGTGINPSPTVGTPGPSPTIRYFSGGGADYAFTPGSGGGYGGGGGSGNAGTANTGGGGGAEGITGAGGKGIVVIRYKFQ
jgi:hypothetical protein